MRAIIVRRALSTKRPDISSQTVLLRPIRDTIAASPDLAAHNPNQADKSSAKHQKTGCLGTGIATFAVRAQDSESFGRNGSHGSTGPVMDNPATGTRRQHLHPRRLHPR